jgi:hypothetical protein
LAATLRAGGLPERGREGTGGGRVKTDRGTGGGRVKTERDSERKKETLRERASERERDARTFLDNQEVTEGRQVQRPVG